MSYYKIYMRHDLDVTVTSNYFDEWTGSWTNRTVEGNYYYQPPFLSPNFDWRNYITGKQLTTAPAFVASTPDNWALRVVGGTSELDGSPPPLGTWSNGQSIVNQDLVNWWIPYAFETPTQCTPSFPCNAGMFTQVDGY